MDSAVTLWNPLQVYLYFMCWLVALFVIMV